MIKGLVQQPSSDYSILRAPERGNNLWCTWSLGFCLTHGLVSTIVWRPPSPAASSLYRTSPIFIIWWCRASGMGVYP